MGILNSLTGGGTMQSLMTPQPLPSMPQQPTYGGLLNNLKAPASPMGVPAKNPNTNIPAPVTTIPKTKASTPAPVASFSNPITSKTASGGTVIDYGSGKVYSNPTDDPSYKPGITAPPVQNPATVQSQLAQAQNQLKTATAMGYGANDQIQKDASGNIIQNPANQPAPQSKYASLVDQGTNALKEEALSQNAIANDPNFSIETQLGKEGQAQQALSGQATAAFAGATAVAPVQVPYSNQYIDPTTGQPIGGGSAGQLPPDAQNIVNTYAQQVQSGAMTRADAESRLAPYGIAGTNALATALGSNFNTNASNASGATTAIGQQLQAAIPAANQALDALQTAFTNLPSLQQTGLPLLNQITQGTAMLSGMGRDQASAFQGALQEARSRIDAALAGAIGVNAATEQAKALLPDNMVPSELPQKIAAAKQYLQNQLASYTTSGNQNTSPANTTSTVSQSTPTKTTFSDGTSMEFVNGQWVASQ